MTEVFKRHPALFRHFDMALPIKFDPQTQWSSGDLKNIRKILSGSERFEETEGDVPFVISAQYMGDWIQICLTSQFGNKYACSSMMPKDYGLDGENIPELVDIVDNFYHVAFTPGVDASQLDMNSLDGYAVQISADEALQKLINTPKNMAATDDE